MGPIGTQGLRDSVPHPPIRRCDQLHLYHWQTKSYTRHKASDKFVLKATEMLDKIMETHQGKYGRVKVNNDTNAIVLENLDDEGIVKFLKTMKAFFETDFSEYINVNVNTDLLNLRDELLTTINQTLYL